MTTTEKRLTEIAGNLETIAKVISKIAKEFAKDGDMYVQAVVAEHESPFGGNPVNLYVCAECNRPIRKGDVYCGKCGKKLIFTQPAETEAEHAAD